MRALILEPDWKTSPIWIDYSKGFDELFDLYGSSITPEDLSLSKQLSDDLWAWADLYDTQMDWDNAPDMFEWTQEQHEAFAHQGDELLARLRLELEGVYEVRRSALTPAEKEAETIQALLNKPPEQSPRSIWSRLCATILGKQD